MTDGDDSVDSGSIYHLPQDTKIIAYIPILNKPFRVLSLKYTAFLLCGMASLWPWNCFLSASDYFQDRLSEIPSLAENYSSTMMTVSTITSTVFNFYLSQRQNHVDYCGRLKNGNRLQALIFVVMTLSVFLPESWTLIYFIFIMLNVLLTSIGSCLTQVGLMALVNTQGSIYANATVVGNAISGVLPSISMIVAIWANKKKEREDRSDEAVKFFLTSTFIALAALISISIMEYYTKEINHSIAAAESFEEDEEDEEVGEIGEVEDVEDVQDFEEENTAEDEIMIKTHYVSFKELWGKLKYVESTIIITFSLTLIFPIFASTVESNTVDKTFFIPLAFLVWNMGDLVGRIFCASPYFIIVKERYLITYSLARILFIPLFMACNIKGRGGAIGDFGYMTVQFTHGWTNGHLFSNSYMRVGDLLSNDQERKAAAAFTALLINLSLLVGSLFSYFVVWLVR